MMMVAKLDDVINQAYQDTFPDGVPDIENYPRDTKTLFVKNFNNLGGFRLPRAIDRVAFEMNCTRQTIYKIKGCV